MITINITFYGSGQEVGRSAIGVRTNNRMILLDCGVRREGLNDELEPIGLLKKARNIDYILISHGHFDHIGFLPKLYANGCEATIFMTQKTKKIARLILEDNYYIKERLNRDRHPVNPVFDHVETIKIHDKKQIEKNISIEAYGAGHIPGATSYVVRDNRSSLYYSGDINPRSMRSLPGAEIPKGPFDVCIYESTYGAKEDVLPSRENRDKIFIDKVKETINRGGNVLIPTFAVGRSTEILLTLQDYLSSGYIDNNQLMVLVDGTMMKKNLDLHNRYYDNKIDLSYEPDKKKYLWLTKAKDRGNLMENDNPKIAVATSGMLTGGSSPEYLKQFAEDKNNTILFVGYQAEDTLGRDILSGKKMVYVDKEPVYINAEVFFVSFTAHSFYPLTLDFVQSLNPKRFVANHGEPHKAQELAEAVSRRLNIPGFSPVNGETISLS